MNSEIPTVTAEQMREVDRIMIEDLHIELLQMMENAGRNLAQLALQRFEPANCLVLAGTGGNGGGGLVAARHLLNRGLAVRVATAATDDELTPAAVHQLDILQRMGVVVDDELTPADLVIDALIGYSLQGSPRARTADLIRWAIGQDAPVLALDTPSGLDVTSGEAFDPCIVAAATLTLGLPKPGLLRAPSRVGELWLADISIPRQAFRRVGVEVPQRLFSAETMVPVPPLAHGR